MRRILFVCTSFGLLVGAAQAQLWWDDFDTYKTSNAIMNKLSEQSDWEEWDGSVNVDADVSRDYGLTLATATDKGHTAKIRGETGGLGNDVVYDFKYMPGGHPTGGYWICSSDLYIADDAYGTGMFIMLNQYPTVKDWSLQIDFRTGTGEVYPLEPAGAPKPLLTNEWVSVITCINLEDDHVDFWYGNDKVCGGVWIGSGKKEIACIDLYGREPGGGISAMYWDNFQMEKVGGPGVPLTSTPNPVTTGSNLFLTLNTEYPSGKALFMLWTINEMNFRSPILALGLDSSGDRTIGGTVPPAAAGMHIGVKAFAIPSGGGQLVESNHEVVVVQ